MHLTYAQRAKNFKHPLAKKLLELMETKQTNLALSADVRDKKTLLKLADEIGPEICVLKTHIDIIDDFDADLVKQLKKLSEKHHFILFEDRKFADIGNTVQAQFRGGVYRIAEWADIVNAHSFPGPGIIDGLKSVSPNTGLLLLAEMSSKGNLATPEYVASTLEMAKAHQDFVIGFIAQRRLTDSPDFIYMTPGIGLQQKSDNLGQGYISPETAIIKNSSDIIIVGRDIYHAESPLEAAKKLRAMGWDAYLKRVSVHD